MPLISWLADAAATLVCLVLAPDEWRDTYRDQSDTKDNEPAELYAG